MGYGNNERRKDVAVMTLLENVKANLILEHSEMMNF